jgi:peptidoglycan/LPS O-acetylase OafA/YrhL
MDSVKSRRDALSPLDPEIPGGVEASGLAGSPVASHFGLGRLRRVTSSGRFIPEIDGLRFVAIMTVVVYHLLGYLLERGQRFDGDPTRSWAFRIFEHGNSGVQLFFVISGFILALPFASHHLAGAKPVSLRKYFLRRLTRLEPPYVMSMLLFFALLVVYVRQSAVALLPHLAASLLYLHNIIYGKGSALNAVAWSLEVEIQFYVLVPLLAQLFTIRSVARRRGTVLGLIVAALAFQAAFISPAVFRLDRSVLNYLQFFLFGFLLADVYLVAWRSAPNASHAWDVVTLLGWPALPVLWTHPEVSRWLFPPLVFLLYCAAFRGTWSRRLFANPWITTVGGMCYTIYLLHYQIISFVGRHSVGLRFGSSFDAELLWQGALIVPVILGVSAVYYALIERPCMRPDWPQRLLARVRLRALVQQTGVS